MRTFSRFAIAALSAATMLVTVPAANANPLPSTEIAPVTVTVNVEEPNFNPAKVVIRPGDTVRWVNTDTIDHTTTSDTGLWDETLSPGESFSFKFRRAGVFGYHCEIFPDMLGKVIVKR
jgi:plastocyanin